MSELRSLCLVRVVDDDPAMLRSWQFLLEAEGWKVVNYLSALSFLEKDDLSVPGCLVLDVSMPEMTGIELQRQMIEHAKLLPIIFVSAHGDIDMAVQALKDGAVDFLPKPVTADRLLKAIEKACQKDLSAREDRKNLDEIKEIYENLTKRERVVADMISKGLMNKQIAQELNISQKTVQVHRSSVCRKLKVRSAAEVARILLSLAHLSKEENTE